MKTEAKVGLFVALGLILLFLLSTQVNKFSQFGKKGYVIYALLDDANGLEKNAKVKIKGVDVGYVKDLGLQGKKVKAKLFIYKGVKIPKDSIVTLQQESLLGTKFLSIEPGSSQEYVVAGGVLTRQEEFASFAQTSTTINAAAKEFQSFIKDLRKAIAGESGEDLKISIENLRTITQDLKQVIEQNEKNINASIESIKQMGIELQNAGKKFGRMSDKFAYTADIINKKLPQILQRVDLLSQDLHASGKNLNEKLPTILDKFTRIEDDLEDIIQENKKPLKKTFVAASEFFDNGGKSFKKLDKYLTSIGQSKIDVHFKSLYMSDDAYSKNSFGINYIPSPNKYYMLDVVSMDDYSRRDKNGNFVPPSKHEDSTYYVSAQYARRYGDLRFRVGLIESTGGVGVDYYLLHDRGKLSMDLYDFNAVNDVRGDNPHLTFLYRQRFLKHLDTYVGVDNVLNSNARNYMFGLGMDFVDQDMKYLLGTVSGAGSFVK
ncbi:MlaD family protein [Nitratiruptor sp. YY09-18]|uniref:MlaD family protein n=1 Tax=Nitratiruptor sp. YY09-18 TaxID=2724901 RepID=UPI0019168C24|nr:MlaD family protein [Nitratiruptor sp. YY09-18]BCD67678.1 phospholipid/cholesterol/gamma-HCH transport system substrate-binding protein [Nitratiruptor sp. YY09-18]